MDIVEAIILGTMVTVAAIMVGQVVAWVMRL